MSPELAAIVTSAVISTVAMYITFIKMLPGFIARREAMWEENQQNNQKDRDNDRQEDIDQRELLKKSTESQIKVSEAQLALLTQLIGTVSQNAASQQATAKELNIIAQASRATEHALTDNTVGLNNNTRGMNELNERFNELLNEGSDPLKKIKETVEDFHVHGIKPDADARAQLDRIEAIAKEINDKAKACEETDEVLAASTPAAELLIEVSRNLALFKRWLETGIEDVKEKSKPIPRVVSDESAGEEAA